MITLKTESWTAELGDDMVWRCQAASVARMLNSLYSPIQSREGVSPADGMPGSLQAENAANALGGSLVFDEARLAEPGVVY